MKARSQKEEEEYQKFHCNTYFRICNGDYNEHPSFKLKFETRSYSRTHLHLITKNHNDDDARQRREAIQKKWRKRYKHFSRLEEEIIAEIKEHL